MTGEEAVVQKLLDCERELRESTRKQAVLNKLCEALQLTEGAWDVQSLVYRRLTADRQVVDVEWQAGHHKLINVSGDSDTAMIRDVMEHLGC